MHTHVCNKKHDFIRDEYSRGDKGSGHLVASRNGKIL